MAPSNDESGTYGCRDLPLVYAITPNLESADSRPDLAMEIAELLQAGVLVQIRQKTWMAIELIKLVEMVVASTQPEKLRTLLINDRCDIANCFPGLGLHLPESGLPITVARRLLGAGRLLGVSCHSRPRMVEASRYGADLVTLSPVFETPGKGAALGIKGLHDLAVTSDIPVYALGGVDLENIASLAETRVHGAACIRGVFGTRQVTQAAAALKGRLLGARAQCAPWSLD
jgi:thiamine-phosphate pyrophosphorylase